MRLGPPIEHVAFPFDATKRAQLTMGTVNHIIEQNIVEFSCCPLDLNLVGNQQFFWKIGTNPLGQLSWLPTQDQVGSTELVRHPCRLWVQGIIVYVTA